MAMKHYGTVLLQKGYGEKAPNSRLLTCNINKKYPHLGAIPDGITPDGGIIEVKCLNFSGRIWWKTLQWENLCHNRHSSAL